MSPVDEQHLSMLGSSQAQTNRWRFLAGLAGIKLRSSLRPPIEADLSVFYIGVGDQLDDDRRRIRPA
jgi:hypothetical protein